MGKDKPIVIWMNGKKTRIARKDDSAENQTDGQLHKKYAAAASEDSNDSDQIPALVRRHSPGNGHFFQPKNKLKAFKPLLIAIFAALLIGTGMGIFMLNMFVDIDNSLAQQNEGISMSGLEAEDENNEQESANTAGTVGAIEPISAYVLQAGVFSDEKNAREMADTFMEAGYAAMIWQKDSKYYVFSGIANSESQGEQLAQELKTQGFEVYVKEWTTDGFEIKMTESTADWLQKYRQQWKASVDTLSTGQAVSAAKWNDLIASSPKNGTVVSEFAGQSGEKLDSLSDSFWKGHIAMLRLWKGLSSLSQ
ncbi:SPOR domain-containing protein [Virgibacillus ihumii]|uniref:SPOR domain-containing protein n=1 Tax=Virgibacillus ihumii TaxID=2686091 RepID=UPI00157D6DA5|nr:SPOR domain-containing protein [Virgibacillus ihumii]